MRKTYRQWVEEGARGFFLTAGIVTEGTVIVATEIAFPDSEMATLLQGYVIRRQSYDPATDGAGASDGASSHSTREKRPPREEWMDDPEEAVTFGWLTWETVGEVIGGTADTVDGEEV
ncbi:MAG TPA: hypothetical protein VE338_22255 [Ktedonobacterales bacterium]|nr:hypothetical protein [Ktedonobacterales bacterium]